MMQRMLFSVFTVTMTLAFQWRIAWLQLNLEQDKLNVQLMVLESELEIPHLRKYAWQSEQEKSISILKHRLIQQNYIPTSRLVSSITGMHVPRNKAIVGDNAFAHEAGIHQHGMLRDSSTYEIMKPQDVGIARSNLVLGKHSGRHAFLDRINDLGFALEKDEIDPAFREFKKLADKKKEIFDTDIEAIVLNADIANMSRWSLEDLETNSGSSWGSTASLKLLDSGENIIERDNKENPASGPIEAVFNIISDITGYQLELTNFEIHSVSVGDDAQGEVTVTVSYDGQNYRGHGISTDIIESGALAYLEVINRIERNQAKH